MRFANIVLGLAAAVSAIDIRLHQYDGCGGYSLTCTNMNPDVCCGTVESYGSVGFYGIPTNWGLWARGHGGGGCSYDRVTNTVRGVTFTCAQGGSMTGGGYGLWATKRNAMPKAIAAPEVCGVEDSAAPACKEFKEPNGLVLADGTTFLFEGMETEQIDELVELGKNGAVVADVPVVLQAFQKSE